jgi:2-alkenal reductase
MEEASVRRRPPVFWVIAFLVVGVVSGAVSGAVVSLLLDDDGGSDGAANGSPAEQPVIVREESALSEAVRLALPSVVTIVNEGEARRNEQGQIIESVSVGSGVVVDERGFVVTNEHVVRNPGRLAVVLPSGEERPAELVSHDAPFTDLAVLRIQPGGLRPLAFGDSDALVVGQRVAAIGSALFDYEGSVTEGIVSGLHRSWLREGVYMEDLIQTDAALNSGNSGGPLINMDGEVVGIATNVVRQLGPVENVYGISFALSSNTVKPIVAAMIESGRYDRPYFGVDHTDLDSEVAAGLGLRQDRGALVTRVIGGSPADTAGIETGDVLLKLGDLDLSPDMPFINALARTAPDADLAVELLRDGETLTLQVQVQPR